MVACDAKGGKWERWVGVLTRHDVCGGNGVVLAFAPYFIRIR